MCSSRSFWPPPPPVHGTASRLCGTHASSGLSLISVVTAAQAEHTWCPPTCEAVARGRGGGQNYGYYTSLNRENEDGVLPNNGFQSLVRFASTSTGYRRRT